MSDSITGSQQKQSKDSLPSISDSTKSNSASNKGNRKNKKKSKKKSKHFTVPITKRGDRNESFGDHQHTQRYKKHHNKSSLTINEGKVVENDDENALTFPTTEISDNLDNESELLDVRIISQNLFKESSPELDHAESPETYNHSQLKDSKNSVSSDKEKLPKDLQSKDRLPSNNISADTIEIPVSKMSDKSSNEIKSNVSESEIKTNLHDTRDVIDSSSQNNDLTNSLIDQPTLERSKSAEPIDNNIGDMPTGEKEDSFDRKFGNSDEFVESDKSVVFNKEKVSDQLSATKPTTSVEKNISMAADLTVAENSKPTGTADLTSNAVAKPFISTSNSSSQIELQNTKSFSASSSKTNPSFPSANLSPAAILPDKSLKSSVAVKPCSDPQTDKTSISSEPAQQQATVVEIPVASPVREFKNSASSTSITHIPDSKSAEVHKLFPKSDENPVISRVSDSSIASEKKLQEINKTTQNKTIPNSFSALPTKEPAVVSFPLTKSQTTLSSFSKLAEPSVSFTSSQKTDKFQSISSPAIPSTSTAALVVPSKNLEASKGNHLVTSQTPLINSKVSADSQKLVAQNKGVSEISETQNKTPTVGTLVPVDFEKLNSPNKLAPAQSNSQKNFDSNNSFSPNSTEKPTSLSQFFNSINQSSRINTLPKSHQLVDAKSNTQGTAENEVVGTKTSPKTAVSGGTLSVSSSMNMNSRKTSKSLSL